ncbi:MAG: hypothetical protein MHM6MM_000263 [Cercozoa sp. M6MM]
MTSLSKIGVMKSAAGPLQLVLRKPKALNAIDADMVRLLSQALAQVTPQSGINRVVVRGEGDKAFCAGGDVVSIRNDIVQGQYAHAASFFNEEYDMNLEIARCSVPFVSVLNGIVMGGGVGVSLNGDTRVASPSSLYAMPETAIGFFCDVGGTWHLPRAGIDGDDAALGTYLALTGARLKGADLVHAGIATHFVASDEALTELHRMLCEDSSSDAVPECGLTVPREELPPPSFAAHLPLIHRAFGKASVAEIVVELEELLETEHKEWAQKQLKTLSKMSPLALRLVHWQLQTGAQAPSIEDAYALERYLAFCFVVDKNGMFAEGVRALLVDKDRSPHWPQPTLQGVTDEDVSTFLFGLDRVFSELDLTSVSWTNVIAQHVLQLLPQLSEAQADAARVVLAALMPQATQEHMAAL